MSNRGMLVFISVLAISALAAVVPAGVIQVAVPEANILALTGQADAQPEDIAIDASGRIIVADEQGGIERILRFDNDGSNGIFICDEGDIIAALEAVNGTAAQAALTINNLSVATDSDIVFTSGDGANPDNLLTVSNVASPGGTITVVSTAVSAVTSPVEGCVGSTTIGNTVYVCLNGAFGAAQDSIVSVDTNAAGPQAAATLVTGQASLEAATTGEAAGGINIGPIAPTSAGDLIAGDSNSAGTTDDVLFIDLPSGAVSLLVDDVDTEADLGTSDIGYTGICVDASGNIRAANTFGFAGANGTDGILTLAGASGGSAFTHLIPESQIIANVPTSGPDQNAARMAFDAGTGRVYWAEQGAHAQEGVYYISQATLPVELSALSNE